MGYGEATRENGHAINGGIHIYRYIVKECIKRVRVQPETIPKQHKIGDANTNKKSNVARGSDRQKRKQTQT